MRAAATSASLRSTVRREPLQFWGPVTRQPSEATDGRERPGRYRRVGETAAGAVVGLAVLRAGSLRWGSTDEEVCLGLPGDELMHHADLTATRATTIRAPNEHVWPWIAQLGQGRGGFYSYDLLENLVGCDIHSADRIVPEWQPVAVGDNVGLSAEVGLAVASVESRRSLVLRGGIAMGKMAAPYDFTWAFVLRDGPGDTTRLLVRERYACKQPWARLVVEPVEALSFVMTQRMLRGIKERAEQPRPQL